MGHVAVQGDDVPVAQVVAVVALGGIARRRAEVAEVAGGPGCVVLVVAGYRLGAGFVPAPGRVVAIGVVAARGVGVGVVPGHEHGARDGVEQVRGEGVPVPGAIGDIS